MLQTQIIHKYEIDDNWVNSLSDQQIDDAVILILKCDTYDDLKEKLKRTNLNRKQKGMLSKFAFLFLFEIRTVSPKEKAAGSPLAVACLISFLICFWCFWNPWHLPFSVPLDPDHQSNVPAWISQNTSDCLHSYRSSYCCRHL